MAILSPRQFTLRRLAAAIAVAVLPLTAFAWETQAQQQTEGQDATVYYVAPDSYSLALYDCDHQPLASRADCRDAVAALYDTPSESYVETYPAYMAYYNDAGPSPVYHRYASDAATPQYYAATPEYYAGTPDYSVYSPSATYGGSSTLKPTSRCAPVYGGGADECLHGSLQGE